MKKQKLSGHPQLSPSTTHLQGQSLLLRRFGLLLSQLTRLESRLIDLSSLWKELSHEGHSQLLKVTNNLLKLKYQQEPVGPLSFKNNSQLHETIRVGFFRLEEHVQRLVVALEPIFTDVEDLRSDLLQFSNLSSTKNNEIVIQFLHQAFDQILILIGFFKDDLESKLKVCSDLFFVKDQKTFLLYELSWAQNPLINPASFEVESQRLQWNLNEAHNLLQSAFKNQQK